MSERRRGLGRGLGALIPSAPPRGAAERPPGASSPVDVFFPERDRGAPASDEDGRDEHAAAGDPGAPAGHPDEGGGGRATADDGDRVPPEVERPGDTGDSAAGDVTEEAAAVGDAESSARAARSEAAEVDDATARADEERSGAAVAGTSGDPAGVPSVVHGTEAGDARSKAGPGVPAGSEAGRADGGTDPAAQAAHDVPGPTPIGAYFAEVDLDAITPNPRQPRQVFDPDDLAELVVSLREVGLLQPVVVRPSGDRYELIMGERRWRAAREAGWTTIPAIVRETEDDDLLRDALLENLHRSQLNPLEEAAAYDQLLRDFGCTHEELAERIGRSRPQVSNTIRLLRLPPAVQRRVAAGVLSAGHARALLALDDEGAQDRLATRIVAEGLSVRATEEVVALGGDAETSRRRPRLPTPVAPRLRDIAGRLSDHFDTRVKVDLGRRKGRIVVEFASLDDLERIVGQMSGRDVSGEPSS